MIGYLLWFFFGLIGAHRFYYGKPVTGVIWFLSLGLLGIGWIVDAFLIPSMDRHADLTYQPGTIDYNVSWGLLWIFGLFGLHRFYQGKILTGILFALTGGLFTIGFAYDVLTLNEQIHERNVENRSGLAYY
ncbi:MAG: NINE protein [Planctomycetota bacterium]